MQTALTTGTEVCSFWDFTLNSKFLGTSLFPVENDTSHYEAK